jgi:hypothetical protein
MRRLARIGLVLLALFLVAAPALAESPGELEAWRAVESAPSDAALVAFLVKYPQSPFRQKAAAMLADLRGTSPADVLDQYGGLKGSPSTSPAAAPASPGPAGSAAAAPEEDAAPKAPAGVFEQEGRVNYDDKSGWYSWEDTLVLNADGTAELTTKYRTSLYSGWYLNGCESGTRVGTYLWKRKYTFTVGADRVTFKPQGPSETSRLDPACWDRDPSPDSYEPWSLDWIGGRLSNSDGEYVRRPY